MLIRTKSGVEMIDKYVANVTATEWKPEVHLNSIQYAMQFLILWMQCVDDAIAHPLGVNVLRVERHGSVPIMLSLIS